MAMSHALGISTLYREIELPNLSSISTGCMRQERRPKPMISMRVGSSRRYAWSRPAFPLRVWLPWSDSTVARRICARRGKTGVELGSGGGRARLERGGGEDGGGRLTPGTARAVPRSRRTKTGSKLRAM